VKLSCYDLSNLEQCCFLDDPGGGAFGLLFWSYPGAFDGLICAHPQEFAIQKIMLMPGGWPGGGWALMELTDALP